MTGSHNLCVVKKRCARCKKNKDTNDFRPDRTGHRKDGLHPYCIPCKSRQNKQWRLDNLEHVKQLRKDNRARDRIKETVWRHANRATLLWRYAKKRAVDKGLPFSITVDDIKAVWPTDGTCPVLKVQLEHGARGFVDTSPTLDAFIPERGYIPGNISVISYRANRIKNDSNLSELEMVTEWVRSRSEPRS